MNKNEKRQLMELGAADGDDDGATADDGQGHETVLSYDGVFILL